MPALAGVENGSGEGAPFPAAPSSHWAYLDNVELGQQVTVCQCHLIAVQKPTCGKFDVLHTVLVDFIREGRIEILIQFLQRFQEPPLQC